MRRMRAALLLITLVFIAAGCGANEGRNGEKVHEANVKIGVMVYRFDDQFIDSLVDVMEEEVMKLQYDSTVDVHFEFVDAGNQQDIQYDQLISFIEAGYDALAINLVDRSEAAKVISLAKEADIPVVFFNREPVQEDMARWNKAYYVGTRGEASGIIQGEIIDDYFKDNPEADLNGDGVIQYVMLQGQFGHQDAILRSQHSLRQLQEAGIEVEELAKDTANWQRTEAQEKMTTWIEVFGDDIELVISNNDAMALGAVDAMKKLEVPLIPTVGVDAIDKAVEAMEAGELIGTVLNDAETQGKGVVKIAWHLANGEEPSEYMPSIEVGKYLWVPYRRISQ